MTLRMRVVPTMKEGRTYDEVLSSIKSYNDSATDMISSNTVKIFYDGVIRKRHRRLPGTLPGINGTR